MRRRWNRWFQPRSDVGPRAAAGLTAVSFLLPLAAWCMASYVPFIWHPDIKLQVSADRAGVATVYKAGDHVAKDFFPGFAQSVRDENAAMRAAAAGGAETLDASRQSLKSLRHLADLAFENGWIGDAQRSDDATLYGVWKGLAEGTLVATSPPLSDENLAIVRENWSLLGAASPTFDPAHLPRTPLLKLVPQGRPANPVYLPSPHEVVIQGYRDFTAPTAGDAPSMLQRFGQSLRIVFGGFLLSCLAGAPLGVVCGTYPAVSRLFEPFFDFFRYLPAPAFSTLLVAVFAAHDAPKVALVFAGTFFQMVLVVANTTRLLDRSLLEAAQTLGARPRQLLTRVVVPGVLPDLYNDLRILLGWSWTWLVIAELIGVKTGLTEVIDTQGRFRNFDSVFPVIILIGVTGFCTDQVLSWCRGVLFPWTGECGRARRAVGRAIAFLPASVLGAARGRGSGLAAASQGSTPGSL
jgi:NitT/TauT family transport system permease protein